MTLPALSVPDEWLVEELPRLHRERPDLVRPQPKAALCSPR
jgi:hypothetical protein